MATRDTDILKEIARLLSATGQFSAVHLHGPEEFQEDGSDMGALAFIEPVSWTEDTDGDDEEGPRECREVTWRLTIEVKDENPIRRLDRLDLLGNVAANTLNGVSYSGLTVAPLSRLTQGTYSEVYNPYRQLQVVGKFTLLLDGYAGNDAADDIDMLL